jgi:hypothetical protein
MDLAQALLCLVTFSSNGDRSKSVSNAQPICGETQSAQDERINLDFHKIGVEDNGRVSVMSAGLPHNPSLVDE